ncbi:MAG: BCCT family transporter [Candidatus Syntrophonatronum acetioxidans]|uniref:BCCT family transporter n=1 Tax=Candidatus Syntrophonatronum acetioxidans TaxID=1795816 RepID=A0A424YDM4_9FIRM|nr:MAG: BCCT family transporter [Candidatus Syntrophonatronum acetioxidans]
MCNEELREVEGKLAERNIVKYGLNLNPVVSFASAALIILFSLYSLMNLEQANQVFQLIYDFVVLNFDWVFIMSSNFFILVCLYLALTRLGTVRIGGIDCEPEFSRFAWYSMLISAGMGIGLMFWAVGEPLHHFMEAPPIFTDVDSAYRAMATTFYHWGLHPWGIYALMALGLAFFSFNRDMPLSLRSIFYPLLKDKVYGIWGDLIDIMAVLSVMFGLATSLGLGIQQINSGLDYLLGIGFDVYIQVILIAVITAVAIISVVSGIQKGVRILSSLNMVLAGGFMVAIFLLGPTPYIIRLFSNSLGLYFGNLVQYASYIAVGDQAWQSSWTVFYLAWWISWSPFVGMFIARISRGRTVRELILGVLIVPSLLSFFWLSVFGGTAISINERLEGGLFAVVQDNLPVALFELIDSLSIPLVADLARIFLFILATVLVINYFITSSDSGSLVVDKITSGGLIETSRIQRVFWACMEGLVAATLLMIGGEEALMALQTAVISVGFPFAIILTFMTISLTKGIHLAYKKQMRIKYQRKFRELMKSRKEAGG